jgi:hypothetical protein
LSGRKGEGKMKKCLSLIILFTLLAVRMFPDTGIEKKQINVFGTVSVVNGDFALIKITTPHSLSVNQSVNVYTYFEKLVFGMKTTGWLHAAIARIINIKDNNIKIKITSHKSVMVVNNKRVWHIKPGVRVKLIK